MQKMAFSHLVLFLALGALLFPSPVLSMEKGQAFSSKHLEKSQLYAMDEWKSTHSFLGSLPSQGERATASAPQENVNWAASPTGRWQWWIVSEQTPGADKAQYGLYIADEHGRQRAFLPNYDDFVGNILVSPDEGHLLVDYGTGPVRELTLYDFRTLKKLHSLTAMNCFAWLDASRFVFTAVDETATPLRHGDEGWLSVAIYNIANGSTSFVKKATATADFLCDEISPEARQLVIMERSVDNPDQWMQDDAVKTRILTMKYPPTEQ